MATPVGHLLAGAFIGVALAYDGRIRQAAAAGALAALVPDLDFVPGAILTGDPARFHHAVSHSLMFALLAAAMGFAFGITPRWRWALIAGLGYASHLALDMVTRDSTPPYGIPLLWPFYSMSFQSPITILPNVPHREGLVISARNVELLVRELLMFGVPFAALLRARLHGGPPSLDADTNHLGAAEGYAAGGERSR